MCFYCVNSELRVLAISGNSKELEFLIEQVHIDWLLLDTWTKTEVEHQNQKGGQRGGQHGGVTRLLDLCRTASVCLHLGEDEDEKPPSPGENTMQYRMSFIAGQ